MTTVKYYSRNVRRVAASSGTPNSITLRVETRRQNPDGPPTWELVREYPAAQDPDAINASARLAQYLAERDKGAEP